MSARLCQCVSLPVCLCVYICVCQYINAHVYMHAEDRGRCLLLLCNSCFDLGGLSLNLELTARLEWSASKSMGPSLSLPPQGEDEHCHAWFSTQCYDGNSGLMLRQALYPTKLSPQPQEFLFLYYSNNNQDVFLLNYEFFDIA